MNDVTSPVPGMPTMVPGCKYVIPITLYDVPPNTYIEGVLQTVVYHNLTAYTGGGANGIEIKANLERPGGDVITPVGAVITSANNPAIVTMTFEIAQTQSALGAKKVVWDLQGYTATSRDPLAYGVIKVRQDAV